MSLQWNGVTVVLFLLFPLHSVVIGEPIANTPPMGWLQWERFRCITDCNTYPHQCVNENLFLRMADRLASDGYAEAGYKYINIDDCWSEHERDENGFLVADKQRFPNGIKHLADAVHAKGLKLGIYTDMGIKTCAGYPGAMFYMKKDTEVFSTWGIDMIKLDGCNSCQQLFPDGHKTFGWYINATKRPTIYSCEWPSYLNESKPKTFASWGIDMIKLDGCNTCTEDYLFPEGHKVFGWYVNETKRSILYSCEWPLYISKDKAKPYADISKVCNIWRNWNDVQDSWQSVLDIINYNADHQDEIVPYVGPGHFNDMDMLLIGDYSLSEDQSKTQFAIWSILAAPLFMSADLENMLDWQKAILLNEEVIAVNQDPLGKMGRRVQKSNTQQTWCKPLEDGSLALAIMSLRQDNPVYMEAPFSLLNVTGPLYARDLYQHKDLGLFKTTFRAMVNPSGVVIVKLSKQT